MERRNIHFCMLKTMNDKTLIRKNSELCFQNQGEKIIVLSPVGELLVMNKTAQFIYENCNKRTIGQIATELFDLYKQENDITYQQILLDCCETIEDMVAKEIVFVEE